MAASQEIVASLVVTSASQNKEAQAAGKTIGLEMKSLWGSKI